MKGKSDNDEVAFANVDQASSSWEESSKFRDLLKDPVARRRLLTLAAVSVCLAEDRCQIDADRWVGKLQLAGDGWSYEATIIASVIQLKAYVNHLGYDPYLPDSINTWVGPIYTLGQLFGGLIAAFVCDKIGRKPVLSLGSTLVLISTSLLIASPNVATVLVARVLQGVSIGFLLLGYQIYAVELASRKDRGFVGSFALITGNIFGFIAACILFGITSVF
jgi:MFS family permease